MNRTYCVYILASRSRNLYTGVTNSLQRRMIQHRMKLVPGFTSRYNIFRLVHFEVFTDIRNAIAREKEIKGWRREKKIWLIKRHNPTWEDLAEACFAEMERFERKLRENAVRPEAAKDGKAETPTAKEEAERRKADPSPPSKMRPGSG
jgi:putative endonuclease